MLRVSGRCLRLLVGGAAVAALTLGSVATGAAQTTITISQPKSQVVYATVRGGSYANKNLSTSLETRAADNAEYHRRALLKFDTHNLIPYKTPIASAILTVTVKEGSEDSSRRIGVYQVTTSWDETQVTWKARRTSQYWGSSGGDLGTKLTEGVVGNAAGTTVSFDITPLVQQAVSGALGSSRYSRVALVDLENSTSASWRAYHTPDDSNTALRPTLKVTYGSTTAAPVPAPAPAPTDGKLLRVLEYNVHHNGLGTDGKYDPARVANWIVKRDPDVVVLIEVEKGTSYSQGEDGVALYKSLVEQRTGVKWYAWDAQNYGDWSSNGLRSVILSKLPFVATMRHEFSVGRDRSTAGAAINYNGRNINIFTAHFDPYNSSNRQVQAKELVSYMNGFAEDRIAMGDFNEQIGNLGAVTTKYFDAWAEAKKAGIAYSAPDNPNGYTRNSRIDYIFYSRYEKYLTLKKVEVIDTRDANGVMPSDHRPVMAEFLVQ